MIAKCTVPPGVRTCSRLGEAYCGLDWGNLEQLQIYGEDWLVLVTTDHGGHGKEHGGHTADERTIWIIATGPGIPAGVLSPGPGHTVIARTVLHYLGIDVPEEWGLVDRLPFGSTER